MLPAASTGDARQEREADAFAAEFLTPWTSILPLPPGRMDLAHLSRTWGVSVKSLIYRCRELGPPSDVTVSRAYQSLNGWLASPASRPNR
ncbi:ImmA/IrrE family metallo-endopeptidase [Streptomyces griseoluteus]|uniref:ImmA/IrrE family metallo-endopeptidase n=1 Tax=Streptomyces griseoluteus TaxID=29306 RepID=UPI00367957E5